MTYDKGSGELDREVRELIEELARQGGRIKNLRSGHVMAFAPDQQTIVTLPGTPGDRNWKRIVLPKLRRGGFRDVR